MHFNDLILRLRLQALGGVAAILTVSAVSFSGETGSSANYGFLAAAFFMVSLAWVAIFIIDLFYYNRLLRGAVIAIKEVEEISKNSEFVSEINLSDLVEKSVRNEIAKDKDLASPWARTLFYFIIFIALISPGIFLFDKFCDDKYENTGKISFSLCSCLIEKEEEI